VNEVTYARLPETLIGRSRTLSDLSGRMGSFSQETLLAKLTELCRLATPPPMQNDFPPAKPVF